MIQSTFLQNSGFSTYFLHGLHGLPGGDLHGRIPTLWRKKVSPNLLHVATSAFLNTTSRSFLVPIFPRMLAASCDANDGLEKTKEKRKSVDVMGAISRFELISISTLKVLILMDFFNMFYTFFCFPSNTWLWKTSRQMLRLFTKPLGNCGLDLWLSSCAWLWVKRDDLDLDCTGGHYITKLNNRKL